jgi:hypothetical protein
MKISFLFLLICISISDSLFSQSVKKPIDFRFKGGEDYYISFFTQNINIPDQELTTGVFGNSITRISLNPDEEIKEITVINPIDSIIDNEVLRVIDLSRTLWKKSDNTTDNQVFFIQIGFTRTKYLPNLFKPKSEKFIRLFPKPIILILEGDIKIPILKSSEELSEKANLNLENGKFSEALLKALFMIIKQKRLSTPHQFI